MEEVFTAKKYGYGLDMGGFWPSDNKRIIAVLEHDSLLRVNRSLALLLDLRFVVRNF